MTGLHEPKTRLREVDQSKYPELGRYTKEAIWRDIGPGGLYLVSHLAKPLRLQPGAWVLDLGCGSAESSIYLAENFKVNVIAADLWRDPTDNARKIESRGHKDNIIPLRLDATQPLPFAEAYFDAILCVNNLNFYGTELAVIDRLARHLKPGGIFCSGGECLNEEFTPEQLANPPYVYSFAEPVWKDDFLTSHSPDWWADHIAQSKELQLVSCEELEDGQRYFEEQALLTEPEGYFGFNAQEARALEIQQIEFGRENRPYMTIYELVAKRK
jgi:cyclopropane fatty-acyl-phospholipid synthase-like methyltransferase